ncbi:uncharacterized protein LOC117194164 isoform X1 [Drosophila miranda]|uniref:uncharacterized protein LOC117194164 isoform X1 n=1 Tax=Drosophila miranda TaxID=7229 RepID=UPI00143F3294|nr:uncharacterized protein LOC117194164 isoform X1 [Drosophila miranda]
MPVLASTASRNQRRHHTRRCSNRSLKMPVITSAAIPEPAVAFTPREGAGALHTETIQRVLRRRESEEEEPYGRQFIAETETFHHTVTPWGLRVTRNHQMSVDVFVPPGRNVNAFFRAFREAAEPIDYRSEPAAPARASPPHAEARPPTPASDPPRCPNPPEESAATTPPHVEAPHAKTAQGPPTEWPTGATEEGNAAPVRQAELTEPEEQWETGPDSGYPTMTLRRVKQPVAEETAPTPQTGEWEGQDELLVDCDLDEILRFLQDESTREGQSPADFSLIEELNQPTQWVIAPADWQVNVPGRALPAGLIEEIHQRLLEAERLRFRSWSWDQCYRVHKRSRAAPVCVDLLPEERGGCNEP